MKIGNVKIGNLNIRNLKIRNLKLPKLKIRNLKYPYLKIRNMKTQNLKIWNLEIWNSKIQSLITQNLKIQNLKIWNLRIWNKKIRNLKIWNLKIRNWTLKTFLKSLQVVWQLLFWLYSSILLIWYFLGGGGCWKIWFLRKLSNLTNIDNNILFPIGRPTRTLSSFQLRLRLMVYQNIHLGCRHIWFDLMSGVFCPRFAPTLFCNSTNLNKQLLFPIGSPNCTRSTFPGYIIYGCRS